MATADVIANKMTEAPEEEVVTEPAAVEAEAVVEEVTKEETKVTPEETDSEEEESQESDDTEEEDEESNSEEEKTLPAEAKEILRKNRKELRQARAEVKRLENELASNPFRDLFLSNSAKTALSEAGLTSGADRFLKMIDLSAVEVDDSGSITGLTEQVEELKKDFPDLFTTKSVKRTSTRIDGPNPQSTPNIPKTSADILAERLGGK